MKKALTVYIDDDTRIDCLCATFVLKKTDDSDKISVWMNNFEITGEGPHVLRMPWKKEEGIKCLYSESEELSWADLN